MFDIRLEFKKTLKKQNSFKIIIVVTYFVLMVNKPMLRWAWFDFVAW